MNILWMYAIWHFCKNIVYLWCTEKVCKCLPLMDGAGYKWVQSRNVSRLRVVRVINDLGWKCLKTPIFNGVFFDYDKIILGGDNMQVQTGYIYHIKDDFFDVVNDKGLMINHENGKTKPTYFTIRDNDILWFIPLSSKVQKYQPIIEKN